MDFNNKVVAITGAAGGIGQVMCRHFGSLGARIAALDKSDAVSALPNTLAADKVRAAAVIVDVADSERVRAGFADLVTALGPVDILINNAGFSKHCSLELSTPATWRADVEGNLNGAYYSAAAVLPSMKQRRTGTILNIGSVNGLYALGDPAYSAAKAALINFTKALAMEYGRFGIRANIILPGTVRTPLWEERAARNPKVLEELVRWYPLGRIVEPMDVAAVAAFLCSEAAGAVTGAVLPVDCGLSAGNIVMARQLTMESF